MVVADYNYTLGTPSYMTETAYRPATGEGAYGQNEAYQQNYIVNGNWRKGIEGDRAIGALQYLNPQGVWEDANDPALGGFYDNRAIARGSNEDDQLGFVLKNAPKGARIDQFRNYLQDLHYEEPDRRQDESLAPMLMGVGLVTGAGLFGNSLFGAGAGAAEGSGGLSWLGNSGLSSIPEAVSSTAAGVGSGATAGLEGLELGGEGVGQALNTV